MAVATKVELPAGLKVHCEGCGIVIPADAPTPAGGECVSVLQAKLCHHRTQETVAMQWAMAAAAWALIYRGATSGAAPDAESVAYCLQAHSHLQRANMFAKSAARSGMTPELATTEAGHRRDGWLYEVK